MSHLIRVFVTVSALASKRAAVNGQEVGLPRLIRYAPQIESGVSESRSECARDLRESVGTRTYVCLFDRGRRARAREREREGSVESEGCGPAVVGRVEDR